MTETTFDNEDLSAVEFRYLLLVQAGADDCRYNHKLPKKKPPPLPKKMSQLDEITTTGLLILFQRPKNIILIFAFYIMCYH